MKPYFYAAILFFLALGAAAQTQSTMGGYSTMDIEAGVLEGSFSGAIDRLTGGVRIVLSSDEPGAKPLPIRAREMKFTWSENAGTPVSIEMTGKVEIGHPQATIISETAAWNFETGDLVFTGNPIVTREDGSITRGERIIANLEKDTLVIYGLKADKFKFGARPSATDSSLFAAADITDWAGFLDKLKAQAGGGTPSPGKQIFSKLDPALQSALLNTPTSDLLAQKEMLLKQMNKVLASPGLYSEAAWQGIAPPEETNKLLAAEKTLSATDLTRLNRLLIESAFPESIASR